MSNDLQVSLQSVTPANLLEILHLTHNHRCGAVVLLNQNNLNDSNHILNQVGFCFTHSLQGIF